MNTFLVRSSVLLLGLFSVITASSTNARSSNVSISGIMAEDPGTPAPLPPPPQPQIALHF